MLAVVRATEIMFLSLAIGISLYFLIKAIVRDRIIIRLLLRNDSPEVPNYNTTRVQPTQNIDIINRDIPEAPNVPNVTEGILVENVDENLEIIEGKFVH